MFMMGGGILVIWMYTLFYILGENWSLEKVAIQNNCYDNVSKKLVLLIYECNPKSIFDLWTWIRVLVKFCSLNVEFCSLNLVFSLFISVASVCQFAVNATFFYVARKTLVCSQEFSFFFLMPKMESQCSRKFP